MASHVSLSGNVTALVLSCLVFFGHGQLNPSGLHQELQDAQKALEAAGTSQSLAALKQWHPSKRVDVPDSSLKLSRLLAALNPAAAWQYALTSGLGPRRHQLGVRCHPQGLRSRQLSTVFAPPAATRIPSVLMVFGDQLKKQSKIADETLQKARKEQGDAVRRLEDAKQGLEETLAPLERAKAELERAEADHRAAEALLAEREESLDQANSAVENAQKEIDRARAEYSAWIEENPLEACGSTLADFGGTVAQAGGTALLTTLFGESKAERQAREAREEKAKSAQNERMSSAKTVESAEKLPEELPEKLLQKVKSPANDAASEVMKKTGQQLAQEEEKDSAEQRRRKEEAELESKRAEEEAKRQEEIKAAEDLDKQVRQKRDEGLLKLKGRRPMSLTDTMAMGALENVVKAAEQAGDKNLINNAIEARDKKKKEIEDNNKIAKLKLFESDLAQLGIKDDELATLNEAKLGRVFKKLMISQHVDITGGVRQKGVASSDELNAGYEIIRKIVRGDDIFEEPKEDEFFQKEAEGPKTPV